MTPVASFGLDGLDLPTGRQLERTDLVRLVEQVAARTKLWSPHLDRTASGRTFASLHRDASVDVWAIFWLPENDTGWHDHDTSSGAVHVIEGALEEHALLVARPERRTRFAGGTSFSFGPSHIHRLTCAEPRTVSIHAYSPPLWRLGQYTVDPEGALHRVSVSYADELRPLETAALADAA
jgi:predicted metal-dependent enzyme (double-stranded beta helix superfamily)